MFRKASIGLGVFAVLAVGTMTHYYMPRGEVVEITGTEVIRFADGTDDGSDNRPGKGTGHTRDVRIINARTPDTKAVRTYRNEDVTAYLKFDSGSVNSVVHSILLDQAKGERVLARVLYYGWRVDWFSMYPNVIGIKEVGPDYVYWPWHAALLILFVLSGFAAVGYFLRRGFLAARARAEAAAASVRAAMTPTPRPATPVSTKADDTSRAVQDFINGGPSR